MLLGTLDALLENLLAGTIILGEGTDRAGQYF